MINIFYVTAKWYKSIQTQVCLLTMRFSTSLVLRPKLHGWSSSIKELISKGKWQDGIYHFYEMKHAEVEQTDPSLFPLLFKACSNISCVHGRSLHACLIKQGFESLTSIGNALMDFYMKGRFIDSAMTVFDCMSSKDSVTWNIMIHGHLDRGGLGEGLWWFYKARIAGFEPNTSILVLVIQACRTLGAYCEGQEVHGYVVRTGFQAIHSVQNSLLRMYVDVDVDRAQRLFDEMSEKDVISWSVMIGGYIQSEEASSGLQLFQKMISGAGIEPDGITAVCVLKGCTNLRDLIMGRIVHASVVCRGLDSDLFVGNSLIDMYCKCENTDSAFKVFNEMPRKNDVSWNSMLSGFVLNVKYSEALSLIYSMGKEDNEVDEISLVNILQVCKYFVHPIGCKSVHCIILRLAYESNEVLFNSLVDACANCYLIEHAWELFSAMKRRDVVSWSTMIAGFTHCGMPAEAISVFHAMNQTQQKPNAVTIINLLEACSVMAEVKRSKWAHGIAIRRGLGGEVTVGTAIVDTYSKCGAIEASRKAFDQISQKNIVSWSAMVSAYGMNGLSQEALSLITEMKSQGLNPNSVTTLSVLSACSHGGFLKEGLSFFKSMVQDHGIEPELEHYSCIVDMLARAGKLDMALDFINNMPKTLNAGASSWGAILSACRIYGNRELGDGAAAHILEMEPLNSAGYLLASSMYAAGGLWADAARMRWLAKERGVRVTGGYSLVHVDNKACKFVAGDKSHPQASEINTLVEELHSCLKIDERDIFLCSYI